MRQTTPADTTNSSSTVSDPERPAVEIVTLVADAKGCRPTDLEPLSNVTDPDAIADLFRETNGSELDIRFDYEGGRVSLSSTGRIEYATDPE